MPKAEKGTLKDIAKRMKSKGLQKLKYYCQMCEKQCRDANGFKCHLTSDTHLRQMKIFSDNAGGMLDSFSKDFETMYMSTLRMRHGTKRVNANGVYQEVIGDKFHIHMNATKWLSLSDFVQYLGKTGKCVVEETERGWYVAYIERDTGILDRQEAMERRQEAEKIAEDTEAVRIELQRIEAAKAFDRAGGNVDATATKIERDADGKQIKLSIQDGSKKSSSKLTKTRAKQTSVFGGDDDSSGESDAEETKKATLERAIQTQKLMQVAPKKTQSDRHHSPKPDKKTDTDKKRSRIKDEPDSKRRKHSSSDRKDYWLHKNILVRVTNKRLEGGKYFKRKAVVNKVHDKYTADIEILDSGPDARDGGDILRLDQDDLDTVIPSVGKRVRVLNGPHRGEKATVVELNKDEGVASLKLEYNSKVVDATRYEDFSKLA